MFENNRGGNTKCESRTILNAVGAEPSADVDDEMRGKNRMGMLKRQ